MREYEFTFVVQPEITDDGLQSLCEKLEGVIERSGGSRLFYEDWGRRRLAYEIKRFQKGHYLVLHYLDEGKTVPELERAARLEDSVLRFLTVQADPDVADVEARKGEAVALEDERKQKAAERAAREAEEAAARAAEAEQAAVRAAEAEQKAASESDEAAEGAEDVESDEPPDADSAEDADADTEDDAPSEDAEEGERTA